MALNYSDFSPFNYVFSNPLSYIDPLGMENMGSDGYSTFSVINFTASVGFAFFGSEGGPSTDPAKKKVIITQNPGSMEDIPESQDPVYIPMKVYQGFRFKVYHLG